MDPKQLKEQRHAISVLKKAGLLPAKLDNGRKLDARSAYPSWKVKGKKLSTWVRKYDDVVSGKVTPLKVEPTKLRQYQKQGESTTQGKFVLVPHKLGETAKLDKGNIAVKSKSGITRVQLPIEYNSIKQYVKKVHADQKALNKMKRKNEYFAFRFYGNNSSEIYADIQDLFDYWMTYEEVEKGVKDKVKGAEVIKNLEIIRVQRPTNWEFAGEKKRKMSKEYNRLKQAEYRKRFKKKPKFLQLAKKLTDALKQKAYRDRVKKNPKKYAKVRKEAIKRSAKSRETLAKNQKALAKKVSAQKKAVKKQLKQVQKPKKKK